MVARVRVVGEITGSTDNLKKSQPFIIKQLNLMV
jgi:hypothetical protein